MHLYGGGRRWYKHGIIFSLAQPKMFIKVAREMIGRSKLKDLKNAQGGQTRADVTTVQVLFISKDLSGQESVPGASYHAFSL